MFGDGQFLQNLVELVRYHAPAIDAQRTAFVGVCAVVLGGLIALYGARLTRLVVCSTDCGLRCCPRRCWSW